MKASGSRGHIPKLLSCLASRFAILDVKRFLAIALIMSLFICFMFCGFLLLICVLYCCFDGIGGYFCF